MRPLRTRLLEARNHTGLQMQVIEKDYLLSWILAGISRVPALSDSLVFKGGTALKKCYFGDYRFSEDLDFSGLPGTPTESAMEHCVEEVCEVANRLVYEYSPVEITCKRYVEREPHPGGQESFDFSARYPWHGGAYSTRAKIEITMDEPVLTQVERRTVLHNYDESLEAEVRVYSLEEIVAEKLRAVLQQTERLRQSRWVRSRARDYYDLWRVMSTYRDQLDLMDFTSFLDQKCAVRKVHYHSSEDLFSKDILAHVESTWSGSLGHLVPELPQFETVINELRPQISAILEPAGNYCEHETRRNFTRRDC